MSLRAWLTILAVVVVIIVGSLFFLQNANEPVPTTYEEIGAEIGSGRIERAEAGFAVTTPEGWRSWDPSTTFQDWWGAGTLMLLWMEPAAETEEWWLSACSVGEECTRERMVEAGGEAYCWYIDDTELAGEEGWSDPVAAAEILTTAFEDDGNWTDVRTTSTDLPSGPAGIVSATDPNGWQQVIYHLSDGDRWYRQICGLLESDLDPGTVAATFEFLAPILDATATP